MAKKKNKPIKIGVISREMIFNSTKERFNPFQGGTGAHKNKKAYTRKQKWGKKYEY